MKFQIPIGPQHPALKEPGHFEFSVDGELVTGATVKEPISLRMTVEGEVIKGVDIRLGYNHRGMEKLAEEKSWIQNIYLTERICGICSHSHSTCYVQGVEKLMEIEPPPRGIYLRYLVSELERIHSHLLWLGVAGHEAGFDSFFMYTWRDREVVMDLLEMISGNRVHYAINTLGGVRRDIDEAQRQKILDGVAVLRTRSEYYLKIGANEPSFVEQPRYRPTLGHVVQLAQGAQVAEEGRGLIRALESQNRLEQLPDGLVAPGVHSAHLIPRLVWPVRPSTDVVA